MLRYDKKQNCFFLMTKDTKLAEKAGLTLSRKARGPNGEKVYYTADYARKPTYNPYAVLRFYNEGDATAKGHLQSLWNDYQSSWVDTAPAYQAAPGQKYMMFQNKGIEFGLQKHNVLIGDEPGLGKTVQAIGICEERKERKNLVICPASIRLHWKRMIGKWTNPPATSYPILKSSDGVGYSNYTIPSYDLTRNDSIWEAICDQTWDNLILDEAHYLKTIDAGRTQAIFGGGRGKYMENWIAKKCGNVIALTGTPLPNRPRECYTLARAINWESIDWMTYDEYQYRFNPSAKTPDNETIEKKGRLSELQARLRTNFMIRRLKQDVIRELPDKVYEFTYLEPNGAIKEIMRRERMLHFTVADLKNPFADIWGQISTIRREMGEAKLPRVLDHIRYLLDDLEIPKIVLFSHHRSVMDRLSVELSRYGIVQVRGGISSTAKDIAVQQFITDKSTRIFSGQLDSAGFGIDGLQAVAHYVVFVEPAWVPGTNEQALDRCHRIGQHENVIGQFCVVEGSLDERVLATVLDKTHSIHKVLDEKF